MPASTLRSPIVPCIPFERNRRRSYYRQIYEGYRAAILQGRLIPGQRLPSSRALAHELGVSRLPVVNAFEQLLHEGYIVARVGCGSFVASSIPRELPRTPDWEPLKAAGRSATSAALPTGRPEQHTSLAPFRLSLPALDEFPHKTWMRLVARQARRMTPALMGYGDPAGYPPLRALIADYLRTARAVRADPDQVLIVAGSQMALQLCARALLRAGDEVFVEEPGYPGAKAALTATGATLRPIAVDGDGLVVDQMTPRSRRAPVVYVTPSHHYPLGIPMSASRRLELLDWARRHQAWIIEDDYDSEYRFASRPLGALQGMDSGSHVIYVGTFSKVLFPSLRIGYLVAPRRLIDAFRHHRDALDLFSPTLYQMVLADFLAEGHFARHLRRMRGIYQRRRDALVAGIERLMPDALTIVNADAGMHLTASLHERVDDAELARQAAARGINLTALSACYSRTPARGGLVLGFGGSTESALTHALERLAPIVRQSMRRRTRA
jgi:GntR family transcriptional regulator/MocR family aminotransferase